MNHRERLQVGSTSRDGVTELLDTANDLDMAPRGLMEEITNIVRDAACNHPTDLCCFVPSLTASHTATTTTLAGQAPDRDLMAQCVTRAVSQGGPGVAVMDAFGRIMNGLNSN